MTGTWQESKWQSMDTAPKNGRAILVWDGNEIEKVAWENWSRESFGWVIAHSEREQKTGPDTVITIDKPLAWLPLPEPPKEVKEKE